MDRNSFTWHVNKVKTAAYEFIENYHMGGTTSAFQCPAL